MQLELITTLAIITAIIIVLALAGFGYYLWRRNTRPTANLTTQQVHHPHLATSNPATPSATTDPTINAAVTSSPSLASSDETVAPAISPSRPSMASAVARQASVATRAPRLAIPEDSVLRRHFLTQLRSEIAAELPPPPTDSVLKRHYEQLLASKMAACLASD